MITLLALNHFSEVNLVHMIEIEERNRIVRFHMAELACPDMLSVVTLAKVLLPSVRRIECPSNGQDTLYESHDGEIWDVFTGKECREIFDSWKAPYHA